MAGKEKTCLWDFVSPAAVERAVSEVRKSIASHWRGPHLLNTVVMAMADGLFRSERADELVIELNT